MTKQFITFKKIMNKTKHKATQSNASNLEPPTMMAPYQVYHFIPAVSPFPVPEREKMNFLPFIFKLKVFLSQLRILMEIANELHLKKKMNFRSSEQVSTNNDAAVL